MAAGPFAHPRWCELTAKREVGPYINAASGYVNIDPLLLATGMSSEGFAVKSDCMTKTEDLKAKSDDEVMKAGIKRFCEPDRFKALNISPINEAQKLAKPEEWKLAKEYAPANATFASVNPESGFTEMLSTRNVIESTYYGNSWIDDGSDTFGLEYSTIKNKKYIPNKFISSDYDKVTGTTLNKMPDFAFMNDENDRNENAKNRFVTNEGPYLNRYNRQKVTQGDKGKTFYKTPEAQVFANAALWKHSQDKFDSARKELIALYKSKGRSSPDYAKAAFLEKELSPTEKAFWSKVFYNGGQGTQAGAWDVLTQFADKGWLANDNYLRIDPGVSLKAIYNNGREVSDSYTEILKNDSCKNLLDSRGSGIKREDYYDADSKPEVSSPISTSGANHQ
jgi:hypothetical protein